MNRYLPWQSYNEFFVSIVYFVQGSAGITGIASSLILREQLGLDFYQMGMMAVASTLPWMIKPVFGLLTDLVPIGKFRRRPYLHIGPLLGFLGYLTIAFYGTSFETFFLALIFANLGLSLTDVATDGFVVEESNDENVSRIQGITQASIRFAAFFTSFFSGLLIYAEIFTPNQMYLLAAAFPLITFIASFFIKEQPAESFKLLEQDAEVSISTESSLEYHRTKKWDTQLFSKGYIISLVLIFTVIALNMAFSGTIAEYQAAALPWLPASSISVALWILFIGWMLSYFRKLISLGLASKMIFLAILFILLWRINPGTGSSMFFYVKDTLGVDERTLGFIDTVAQLGSILGVILAVKIFDRIPLKNLLITTVVIAALFGFTSFAVTRPEFGTWLGETWIVSWLGTMLAIPVYFCESLFNWLIAGQDFGHPLEFAMNLKPIEHFLFAKSIVDELVFMIAYIPLLKFAVLICPQRAEATNYAIIASVMNMGLAISTWASGLLYNTFMGWYHPDLAVTEIQVDVIELLIWVNIITSLMCLIVIPFLKTEEFKRT